jgi:enoyl-[acyl-carrier protein] reductase I
VLMEGKSGLVVGVANKRSIAWAIAQRVAEQGAQLALSYQNERLGENVRELGESLKNPLILPLDVGFDDQIDAAFTRIREEWGRLDFLVHAVAYAPKQELEGEYVATTREGYRIAQEVSCYSLTALARAARPLMKEEGGSILALTYLGGERVVPHYNVMGVAKAALESSVRYLAFDLGGEKIRVNALSAGPIKTLAAAGISGFSHMLEHHRQKAPLKRNTELSEVADAGLFLLSNLSRGVTGQVLYVDGGYNIIGM